MRDGRGAQELPVPPDAAAAAGSAEVLRAWIVNGGLSVSLISGFDGPATWGLLLVDVARHASRCFEADGICSEMDAMDQIVGMLMAELSRPTDLGTTEELKRQ